MRYCTVYMYIQNAQWTFWVLKAAVEIISKIGYESNFLPYFSVFWTIFGTLNNHHQIIKYWRCFHRKKNLPIIITTYFILLKNGHYWNKKFSQCNVRFLKPRWREEVHNKHAIFDPWHMKSDEKSTKQKIKPKKKNN